MQPRVWRVKGKWRRLMQLYFFLWSELIFLWSELILVQFYFIFYFFIRSELIRPGLAVPVDLVRLLYLSKVNKFAEKNLANIHLS